MLCDKCSSQCLTCSEFEAIVTAETDATVLKSVRLDLSKFKYKNNESWSGRFADSIVNKVGTMPFFYVCCLLAVSPLAFPQINTIVQYISSAFLQLVLLPLIMIAQNRQEAIVAARAEREYRMLLVSDRIDELAG
jgi:uncharacterized membrane protein